ncbi:MAG TPA: hypothetical protein VM261_07030 [Kofleriaceae bacterium]|nr:hypothetical protein [Kofleriaceae bacterium]
MRLLRHVLTAALALGLTAQSVSARSFAGAPPAAASNVERVEATQRARLKKLLAARRARNVKAFTAYVANQRYPENHIVDGEINIWIDDEGRRCAAAQMIWASGAKVLVEQQAAEDNLIRLANVTEGPLLDWILTSGLTHDEVVLIQRPFRRPPHEVDTLIDARAQIRAEMTRKYQGILAELARTTDDSLDAAVDTLMEHPDLVAKVLRAKR